MSRFFARVVRRYFRHHFRSVMVANASALNGAPAPLVVFGNHVSWWDPMLILLLARVFMPHRQHYAPMDARQLERYSILRRIGIFPVDSSDRRGVASFLATSEAILKSGGVLWITPQARFADVREFPLRFKAGLALIAKRVPDVAFLPLAVEYTFWDERLPEALARAGEVMHVDSNAEIADLTAQFENVLAAQMMALQADSLVRDSTRFETVLTGARGPGGFYGLLQRLRGHSQIDHTQRPSR